MRNRFETTMAAKSFAPFLVRCRQNGYRIGLIDIWLQSPELAVARVAQRVSEGGHLVAEDVVRERYVRGLANFFRVYRPIADQWAFFDNTGADPVLVAESAPDPGEKVLVPATWARIKEMLDGIA